MITGRSNNQQENIAPIIFASNKYFNVRDWGNPGV